MNGIMNKQPRYGTVAKIFHWLIVALLLVQYLLGWFMPDIHRDMKPGDAMTLHISTGIVILALIVLRFFLEANSPCRARNFASNLAARGVRGRALVTLCACVCDHIDRLVLRLLPRLVHLAILCGTVANACCRGFGHRAGGRTAARDDGVGVTHSHRRSHRNRNSAPILLSRSCHATDAADSLEID